MIVFVLYFHDDRYFDNDDRFSELIDRFCNKLCEFYEGNCGRLSYRNDEISVGCV